MTVPTSSGEPDIDGDAAATFCATLVDEWRRAGLTDAVVSPGSRSTPLALAVAEDDGIRVHVVHDERSAAFTALGLGIATGRPAVLLCTSGTAAVNLHPAVVEAHQAAVPMIVVTADRPPELHGVGAPQTIDQRHLYGASVRWYCEPGPAVSAASAGWRHLARDAWTRTLGTTPGPVHLDLAFREPLLGTVGDLPPVLEPLAPPIPGASWGMLDEELGRLVAAASGRRGVLVVGARAALDHSDVAEVLRLAEHLGWPVLADGPSGCRRPHPHVVTTADQVLRHDGAASLLGAEVALRIGGLHASKVLDEWLLRSGALQFGVDRYALVPDPRRVLVRGLPADPATVCRQLVSARPTPGPVSWMQDWRRVDDAARLAIDAAVAVGGAISEPAAAVESLAAVPDGGTLVVSSSMPVRDLEWFAPARDHVQVVSNRGANGIDGVTSTAVGVALSWTPTVLLIGDVAFLHDTGALVGLTRRGVALVIVVIDNDGGGIFSFLPQAEALDEERFEQLFGTPHGLDVVAVAEAHGLPGERVTSLAGLRAALNGAVARGGPRMIAVRTDRGANVAVHEQIRTAVAEAIDPVLGASGRERRAVEAPGRSGNVGR